MDSPPPLSPPQRRSTEQANHKRKRTSAGDVKEVARKGRTAQDEVAQEVDLLILDYQIHQCIQSILRPKVPVPAQAEATRQTAAALWKWISIYNSRFDRAVTDPDLRLRLQIAQFVVLYHHRMHYSDHTPDRAQLSALRKQNMERAKSWIVTRDRVPHDAYAVHSRFLEQLPVETAMLRHYRTHQLQQLSLHLDATFYGTSASVSILDLLPQFMEICAVNYCETNTEPTAASFGLMVDLMRQAYLEQFLAFDEDGCDAVDVAFSWGCYQDPPDETSRSAYLIDRMFRDSRTGDENHHWQSMKQAALNELMLPIEQGGSVPARLQQLAELHPLREVDARLREFVVEVWQALTPPVLVQLESGCLQDMSPEETAAFLQSCGIERGDWSDVEEWVPWISATDTREQAD